MKAHLMYKDRDFDLHQPLLVNEKILIKDIELLTLFNAMASGNKFVLEIAIKSLLNPLIDKPSIHYRQDILKDCLNNPSIIRQLYQIPLDSIENKQKNWLGIFATYPSSILSSAVNMLSMFVGLLKRLKSISNEHSSKFESEGFNNFFAMIQKELDDDFFNQVEGHLNRLKFREGVLLSAELGQGNEGTNYVLRKIPDKQKNWIKRTFPQQTSYSFSISDRDDHGARALGELKDKGINLVANALGQSADHIDGFLNMLRNELAFYIGCLNLYDALTQLECQVSFPSPAALHDRVLSFDELYDVCLALTMKQKIVGNCVGANNKNLLMITGANQGGKSTYLRSIGLAQVMMQAGMFVPARSFSANICSGIYTHFKRQEDVEMKSGKLDEELSRMNDIISNISPNALVLFNESFAATNEREGSEIANQITRALLDKNMKVVFVTHMFQFAHGFYENGRKNSIFLRAERRYDGERTFKILEGEPQQTSYGKDVYFQVFGRDEEG